VGRKSFVKVNFPSPPRPPVKRLGLGCERVVCLNSLRRLWDIRTANFPYLVAGLEVWEVLFNFRCFKKMGLDGQDERDPGDT
jgi:hypothetical protein